MNMDFEIVDDNHVSLLVSQVNIETEDDPERVVGVFSSQITIPPNENDLKKLFGRPHVEIDGKQWSKTDIVDLVAKNKELEANLSTARQSNRKLVKEIREEKKNAEYEKKI